MSNADRIEELRSKYEENPRRYFAPLANEFRKAGDLAQAIAICREHLPKQPGHMSGYIVFGQTLYEANSLDEARTVFEQALALDPENLIALKHLGDIARTKGENAVARRWYERVLDVDPRNEEITTQLATLSTPTPPIAMPGIPAPVGPGLPQDLLEDASGIFRTFDPASSLLEMPDDVVANEARADWEPRPAAAPRPTPTHEPIDLDFPEDPEPVASELEEAFEEGLIAPQWPDTTDLVSRLVSPFRAGTPISVPVTAEAIDAFGRESHETPSAPAESHKEDLELADDLVEAYVPAREVQSIADNVTPAAEHESDVRELDKTDSPASLSFSALVESFDTQPATEDESLELADTAEFEVPHYDASHFDSPTSEAAPLDLMFDELTPVDHAQVEDASVANAHVDVPLAQDLHTETPSVDFADDDFLPVDFAHVESSDVESSDVESSDVESSDAESSPDVLSQVESAQVESVQDHLSHVESPHIGPSHVDSLQDDAQLLDASHAEAERPKPKSLLELMADESFASLLSEPVEGEFAEDTVSEVAHDSMDESESLIGESFAAVAPEYSVTVEESFGEFTPDDLLVDSIPEAAAMPVSEMPVSDEESFAAINPEVLATDEQSDALFNEPVTDEVIATSSLVSAESVPSIDTAFASFDIEEPFDAYAPQESFAEVTMEALAETADEDDADAELLVASATAENTHDEEVALGVTEEATPAFVTETMAELLISQGFVPRAIEIYEELVRRRAYDPVLLSRLAELRAMDAAHDFAPSPTEQNFDDELAEPESVGELLPQDTDYYGSTDGQLQSFATAAPTPRFATPLRNTPLYATPVSMTPLSATPIMVGAVSEQSFAGGTSFDDAPPSRTARDNFAELARRRVPRRTPTHATAVADDAAEGLSSLFGSALPTTPDELAARALADAFGPVQDSGESLFDVPPTSAPVAPLRSFTPRSNPSIHVGMGASSSEGRAERAPSADYSFDRFFPDPATVSNSGAAASTFQASAPATQPPANEDLVQFSAWLKGLNNA